MIYFLFRSRLYRRDVDGFEWQWFDGQWLLNEVPMPAIRISDLKAQEIIHG